MEPVRGIVLGVALVAAATLGHAGPSAAAGPALSDGPVGAAPSEPPAMKAPSVDELLDRLAKVDNEDEAKALEDEIVQAWNRSGSDTVDLLSRRAAVAIKEKNYGVALQYLDTVIALKPDFAEGWNMRATVYYLIDEYELSLADISRVLALQPRHFGALSGLGMIFRELDEPEKALEAFRKVLKIDPYFGNAREAVEKLEPEVEGRDI